MCNHHQHDDHHDHAKSAERSVLVFGNTERSDDSLPVRLLPRLRSSFTNVDFRHLDPNEEWSVDGDVTVIDTVVGLKEPRVFDSLDAFSAAPRLTTHDFDAYAQLRWLHKLGHIRSLTIIGLPPETSEEKAQTFIENNLKTP